MASAAKIISNIKKEDVKNIIDVAGNLLKGKDKVKLKKAEDLLNKEKKKIKVGKEEVNVTKDGETESVVKLDKKSFDAKKPKDITEADAQEVLLTYNSTKLTPKVLSDFNINNMKSEKDIIKFIELISKKYSGDIKSRTRGIQDHTQTKKLADVIGGDPKRLVKTLLNLKTGDTLNAEYMLAARELLAAGMAKLDDMAQLVTNNGGVNATEAMKLEFRQHFALMSEFQKIIKGVQTETARTLQSMKIPTRTKQYTNVNIDDLNKSDLIIQLGGGDEITNLATLYLRSGTDNAKLKFTQETGGFLNLKKVSDSIGEIFINSILSAPGTHIRNTVGNWVAQGIIATERKVAARLYGNVKGSGIAAYEDVAAAYGTTMANQEMFLALSTTFKQKGGLIKLLKNYDELVPATHAGSKLEMHGNKLTAENFNVKNKVVANGVDLLGNILTLGRVPTKLLTTGDNIFKNREYRAQLFKLAYREGMENYHKGTLAFDDIGAFIAHRVDTPTEDIVTMAKKEMSYSVFQTKAADRGDALGKLAKIAQDLKGSGGGYMTWLTNYYIPFTQTPINIAGFVAERTPGMAQLLTGYQAKLDAGGAIASMAKTKMMLGYAFYTAAIGSTYAMSGDGQRGEPLLFSGADIDIPGNSTGGKYETMQAFGFEPNSIRIPNGKGGFHQFNLTGNDPISAMFSQAGNSAKFIESLMFKTGGEHFFQSDQSFHAKFGGDSERNFNAMEAAQLTMGLILSFGENLSNSTYLAGASNLFTDIQNATHIMSGDMSQEGIRKAGKQWAMKFASGFIPNLAKKTSKAFFNDDYQKISTEWNTLIEKELFNKDLPDKYTIFGKKKRTFGSYKYLEFSKAQKEVYRVMPKLTRTSTNLQIKDMSIHMTAKEQEFFQYQAGSMFVERVEALIENPIYKNKDKVIQKVMIENALKSSRSDARVFLKSDGTTKLSNGLVAPKSEFFDDISVRFNNNKLEQLIDRNEGDPFKDQSLKDFENSVNKQNEIIEANQ